MFKNNTNDDSSDHSDSETDDILLERPDDNLPGAPTLPPPGAGSDPKTIYAYLEKGTDRGLRGAAAQSYSKKQTLTEEQKEIIIGTMLGDATIPRRDKGARPGKSIKFDQRLQVYPYVHHLYNVFQPLVGTGPKVAYRSSSGKYSIWFRTYAHDSILFYHNLFYVQDPSTEKFVKRVPPDIHKYLTARSLAYWFMDDGTYNYNRNTKNYLFSTQGFKKHEVEILCKALKTCFDISANVHKDREYYRIYIKVESSSLFLQLIDPYILSVFRYKL